MQNYFWFQTLFLFVFLPFFPLSENPRLNLCPNDWVQEKGKCYKFFKDFESWIDTQKFCSIMKSCLLMIQDKAELVRANLLWKLALFQMGKRGTFYNQRIVLKLLPFIEFCHLADTAVGMLQILYNLLLTIILWHRQCFPISIRGICRTWQVV